MPVPFVLATAAMVIEAKTSYWGQEVSDWSPAGQTLSHWGQGSERNWGGRLLGPSRGGGARKESGGNATGVATDPHRPEEEKAWSGLRMATIGALCCGQSTLNVSSVCSPRNFWDHKSATWHRRSQRVQGQGPCRAEDQYWCLPPRA